LAQRRKPVRAPELAALGEGDEIRLRTTAPSSWALAVSSNRRSSTIRAGDS